MSNSQDDTESRAGAQAEMEAGTDSALSETRMATHTADSTADHTTACSTTRWTRIRETLTYFLSLGTTGFGGPLALVGSMQRDLVEKRKWMSEQEFAQAFALIKAMPGPVAFQTAVYLGRKHSGFLGACAAGFGINAPAFLMMIAFGVFYTALRGFTATETFLMGMQASALGVILASAKGLGWSHRKKTVFWILGLLSLLATFAAPSFEPLMILGCGVFTAVLFQLKQRGAKGLQNITFVFPLIPSTFVYGDPVGPALRAGATWWNTWLELSWATFKAGAFVFGSGVAIVPMMESDFVQRLGWLTHTEFMDALAFGQITPGPVVITATFIGYKALGFAGAVTATLSVYAASFFHQVTWFPAMVTKLSRKTWIQAFLTGAIAAVVGAIVATVINLASGWTSHPLQYLIVAASLAVALLTKVPSWLVIPAGGAIGLLFTLVV